MVSSSSEEVLTDPLLDRPISGFVVMTAFVSGLAVFGLSVLGSVTV